MKKDEIIKGKNKDVVSRIKLTKGEKIFLCSLLSFFDDNQDEMELEIKTDIEAKKAFENLSMACGYFNVENEMDEKTTQKCLKILGS